MRTDPYYQTPVFISLVLSPVLCFVSANIVVIVI